MELEQRVQALEEQVRTLKFEIQKTLVDIQASLPEKTAEPPRWEKKAWVLALLNIMMAVVLFTNIYFFLPGNTAFGLNSTVVSWLRALWVAIAFLWLLLQMYPLMLLLEQEDRQWQGVVWRNAVAGLRDRPVIWVLLTLVVLIVSIVDTLVPSAWLFIALTLLLAVAMLVVRNMFDLVKGQRQAH
ncbi:MAG: hypothetical protein M1482_09925 [Chloroflexi bacterium]|nr:hypothetical protein [Chloroflexota bacterium]